tara:strand:- start:110 stop:319 length:210 start_codon:yes stop_codon:yes gene_type:complete
MPLAHESPTIPSLSMLVLNLFSDPMRAAEIVYNDIVFDGIKNWIANNGPDLDLDEVIASLGRYIVGNPA